jgi:Spy/CpxP family protein refolding chaperone
MFAKDLGLRPEQKTKMDGVFNAHRTEIFGAFDSLRSEEMALDKIMQGAHPDEAGLDSAIDRVAHARASLEKANAHMLLAIRREMDDQQIERLKCYRHFPGSWHPAP